MSPEREEIERRAAMLRRAFPDPVKRAIWCFGAVTASMNGLARVSVGAADAMRRLAENWPTDDEGAV